MLEFRSFPFSMSFGSYGGRAGSPPYLRHNPYLPPAVKWLLIVNISLFVVYFFAYRTSLGSWFNPFWLDTRWVVQGFAIWQFVTYLFLHSPADFSHILWNMLSLWMFGKDLEATWGTRRFLNFYFFCGIGAGICAVMLSLLFGADTRTIGSSGAVYGLLLAFALMFPEAQIILLIFPMKAKYAALIIGAMTFMSTFRPGDGVSHVAHLGGMLFALIYLKAGLAARFDFIGPANAWYRNWKHERAKRKFQVYMRKQQGGGGGRGDRDRTIH